MIATGIKLAEISDVWENPRIVMWSDGTMFEAIGYEIYVSRNGMRPHSLDNSCIRALLDTSMEVASQPELREFPIFEERRRLISLFKRYL